MMKSCLTIVAATLLLGCAVQAEDWPTWRGPAAGGVSQEKNFDVSLVSEPAVLWERAVGLGYSAVSVKDGKLYTAGHADGKDTVYCLDSKTGQDAWSYDYEIGDGGKYKGPRATPVIVDGKVYAQSWQGRALCLSVADGSRIWEASFEELGGKDIHWHFAGSALIHKDLAIYNSGQYGLALNKDTGKKVWASPAGKGNYSTPYAFKIGARECVALFGKEALYAVDPAGGELLWELPWNTRYDINAADPVAIDNQMFISSGYGHGAALLQFTADKVEIVWQNKNMVNQFDSSVVIDGHIYGISGNTGKKNSTLSCLDWKSGDLKWSEVIGGYGAMSAVGDTLVYLTEKSGDLVAARATPDGYKELARNPGLMKGGVCWTAPVYANGVLYCRNSQGKLLALAAK